jgi:NTP pyrophosphatase (non-canonical NTP hydrolase)
MNKKNMNFKELEDCVLGWADAKNLLKKENAFPQFAKVIEETGELANGMIKGNEKLIEDSLGDAVVTLIILSNQLGYKLEPCLEVAWNEIKDRTGKTVNGSFIKD